MDDDRSVVYTHIAAKGVSEEKHYGETVYSSVDIIF